MRPEYAIIVKNKTRLETLIERFNTQAQAQFYIEKSGGYFADYELEHQAFYAALNTVQTQLSTIIKHKIVDRHFLPSYIFSEKNIIIVVGQDGLVANTAKYAKGLPIIAVNPDKNRYDGVLLPFDTTNFLIGVEQVLNNQETIKIARFAEVKLNDGQRLLAFNDLYIGAATHVSARYAINFNGKSEEQSSSGIIVSTKSGATGWLSSVFNMAYGINKIFNAHTQPLQLNLADNELFFAVREPFVSVRTKANISAGILSSDTNKSGKRSSFLTIQSFMPTNGVIFSDGIESDFLKFNSGAVATIGIAAERARLVVK